ncbi:hypothetical protein CDD83_1603 [Cordyceps sp. RAO-2017]|nr:hypothetical protein CDD83_1603 [Cordyceps sp. RAO-2017]
MIQFHSTFIWPYVRYSVLPAASADRKRAASIAPFGVPVPGIVSPKMMHDLGVSRHHTVIIDTPMYLNPFHLLCGKPVIGFDPREQTRFGVFPRHRPEAVEWFATEACCIFHTVNTWDETSKAAGRPATVHMLACRVSGRGNGPSFVYAAGGLPVPEHVDVGEAHSKSREECRLYYYQFALNSNPPEIAQQWALSAIPFELPHIPRHLAMTATRFVYGCSVRRGDYAEQLADSLKLSSLVKIDVRELIARGIKSPPTAAAECVDERSVSDILAADDPDDPVRIFPMPERWYAQECAFVPRAGGASEDDGWLPTFAFDESQLDSNGDAPESARSELWIIDARTMRYVVARIRLPRRVPYGLHGNWFSAEDIALQHPVAAF